MKMDLVEQYHPGDRKKLSLTTDLAGQFPIYIYLSENKKVFLFSRSIKKLLDNEQIKKPLNLSLESISFFLQSGVVPPPKTIYKNIYILGVGDSVEVSTKNDLIDVQFRHEFPFKNSERIASEVKQPKESEILGLLAESAIKHLNDNVPTFLFHSAGKDSNTLALALADAGLQDKVTLITHKSSGKADESKISAEIAKRLGFSHKVLEEVTSLSGQHKDAISNFFHNSPFPCSDNVTLAYPLYTVQLPELKGANIIDGGGNDSYMSTPPTKREKIAIPFAKLITPFHIFRRYVNSESIFSPLLRTPAEWCGAGGMSYADTAKILEGAINVRNFWKKIGDERSKMELFDFKTSILTPIIASEIHIRKARIFSDSVSSNLILPFMDEKVSSYFQSMPEKYLFDRETLKNKVILREILKDRIGLDSDAVGKMGWTYNSPSIVIKNIDYMLDEINRCSLWSTSASGVINRLKSRLGTNNWSSITASKMIYRLFLLSGWYNSNRFIQ